MNNQWRQTNMETENKKEFENKNKVFENKPIVETQLSMSKDKKYVLHRTIITDIKPVKYIQKVLEGK